MPGDVQPVAESVPVERLYLDEENPRLASAGDLDDSQLELIRALWLEEAVDEVAQSIAENGYYQYEPLLVIPHPAKSKSFIVVEGNRRLAAVKLLRSADLRRKLKVTELPDLSAKREASLKDLPVLIFPEREPLWAYLGFRHVNGTKGWDPFSKARYVADVHEKFKVPLNEIARRIGDRHSTVLRLYRGFTVLMQAEKHAGFDREDRVRNKFYFSHLYTATDQPEFQKFLGIDPDEESGPNPVPKSRLKELAEFMVWLYGKKSEDREPVVRSQNPDLNRLRAVVGKPTALAALRSGRTLDAAHNVSIGDARRFREAVAAARDDIQQAKATVTTGYSGDLELLEQVEDIAAVASTVVDEMKKKRGAPKKKAP